MPDTELGMFITFIVIPLVSYFAYIPLVRLGTVGAAIFFALTTLGFVMLMLLALFFFVGQDVVLTKTTPVVGTKNSTAFMVNNITATIDTDYVYVDKQEKVPIINQFHYEMGWLFFAFAIILLMFDIRVILS